jgi:two-component system, response regulator PdtaR
VNPTKSAIADSHAARRLAQPDFRPDPVFSRDNDFGAAEGLDAAARIMIVEDDFLVASEMEGALTQVGFEVIGIAGTAEQALQLAAAERPVLVVMDIRLGGKRDGIDTALELFANHGIRCVFATAHQTPDTHARAQAANPLTWIAKPYTMRSLIDAVRRAM